MGSLLIDYQDRLPLPARSEVRRLAAISKSLRRERELAFYGDVDFIPTEEYGPEQAAKAAADAAYVVAVAERVVPC